MRAVSCAYVLLTTTVVLIAVTGSNAGAQADPPQPDKWTQLTEIDGGKGFAAGVDQAAAFRPGSSSGSQDKPGAVAGRGDGAGPRCPAQPVGPIAQIQKAVAAARAAEVPTVSDPSFTEDVIQGQLGRQVVTSWYRFDGRLGQIKLEVRCPGEGVRRLWAALQARPNGAIVVRLSAADLLPGIHAEVIRHLPSPVPRIGPADEDPDGWTYVNNRTFFWVDQAAGQWAPVSGTVSAAGISVTVVAQPVNLVVDPGDGHPKVTCRGPGTAVTSATYRRDIQGCAYVYPNSSAMAANGRSYPVTTSIVWHVTWTASTGEGGDLGFVSTTSDIRDLQVAEVQAVIVTRTG
jgi:hypothetical protein